MKKQKLSRKSLASTKKSKLLHPKRTVGNKKTVSRISRALKRVRFLPALAISVYATLIWAQPGVSSLSLNSGDVLAKATNISISGLLSATNVQRSSNGVGSLGLDSQLNAAAQAKANDMVSRGYWAHVTPDGKQPWWFITNAGYQYLSAGENLAYGFMTSDATITGWMNSPSHRTNLLNGTFTEVGFGIADTNDYIYNDPPPNGPSTSHGPQTIVVAMYAKPQVGAAEIPTPVATNPAPTPPKVSKAAEPQPETKSEIPAEEEQKPEEAPAEEEKEQDEPIAIAGTGNTTTGTPTRVSRIQLLTGGGAIWSATFVVLAVLSASIIWLMHKGVHARRMLLAGERFLAHHHIHLDLTVLSVIYLGAVLLTTSGTIR